jgi:hypothetical protein
MSNDAIQEIELSIKEAQKIVDLGAAVQRLASSRDFKKVVMEMYFEKEAVRLVHLKANPAMQDKERQEAIVKEMDAIGSFYQFLRTLEIQAEMARRAIDDGESLREEILAEGNA